MNSIRVARRRCELARGAGFVLSALLALLATGCMVPLAKHAAALSAATAPVVDQAAAAYRAANAIHQKRTDYDAIGEFDKTDPVYNPRKVQPLLTEQQIDARLTVLKAFQCYVQMLAQITAGTDSQALDTASTSLGGSLAGLGNTLKPAAAATAADPTPAATISTKEQNLMSTGVDALGQFLIYRAIKKDLPSKVIAMDPHVQQLCKLMADEVDSLHDLETKDFDSILNRQTLYLRDPHIVLGVEERREAIMKLPELAREQSEADEQLTELKQAIVKLALTHHAFAAEAQGNNPESIGSKLDELVKAGKSLGKFYSSLPTS